MRRGIFGLATWAVAFLPLLLAGCWGRREVETLAFVTALGIDRASPPDSIELTFEMPIPSTLAGGGGGMAGGGGGGGPGRASLVVIGRGRDVLDALHRSFERLQRVPVVSHSRFAVVGEPLARQGVGRVLDGLGRQPEFRRSEWFLVTPGPARLALQANVLFARYAGQGVDSLLVGNGARRGTTPLVRLNDFLYALSEPGIDPVAGMLEWYRPETPTGQELLSTGPAARTSDGGRAGRLEEASRSGLRLGGTAIFQDDRLVGYLTPYETTGFLLATGRVRGTLLTVPCPERPEASVAFLTRQTSGKVTYRPGSMPPRFRIEIKGDGTLVEYPCSGPIRVGELNRAISRQAARQVQAAVERLTRELRADPIGFGRAVFRHDPALWRQLEPEWRSILPSLQVDVESLLLVRRTGLTAGPLRVKTPR